MITDFIISKKLTLRCMTQMDLSNTMDWLNDQETTVYTQHGIYPMTVEGMLEYFNIPQKRLYLAIEAGGIHIGNITLGNIHDTFRTADLSILIGKKRGEGYGKEAVRLVVDHAFRRMNINRIEAGMVEINLASKAVFISNGFVYEGTRREAYYCEGGYKDVSIYSILKNEWRATC